RARAAIRRLANRSRSRPGPSCACGRPKPSRTLFSANRAPADFAGRVLEGCDLSNASAAVSREALDRSIVILDRNRLKTHPAGFVGKPSGEDSQSPERRVGCGLLEPGGFAFSLSAAVLALCAWCVPSDARSRPPAPARV